jgi:shikimate kinase
MAMADDPTLNLIRDNIRARLGRPLVLIGMMGSGKSRLGRMLAEALDLPFTDSDEEIERAAGCTIADIFERYGEPFFRDRERAVIARLLEQKQGVIATGGGAPVDPETAAAIRGGAVSIWVRTDLAVLVERTGRNSNRPLLKGGDPAEILGKLAERRNPVYEQADIIVESHNGPVAGILNDTLRKLDTYLYLSSRRGAHADQ